MPPRSGRETSARTVCAPKTKKSVYPVRSPYGLKRRVCLCGFKADHLTLHCHYYTFVDCSTHNPQTREGMFPPGVTPSDTTPRPSPSIQHNGTDSVQHCGRKKEGRVRAFTKVTAVSPPLTLKGLLPRMQESTRGERPLKRHDWDVLRLHHGRGELVAQRAPLARQLDHLLAEPLVSPVASLESARVA
eukprot:6701727-Prymnesium_polylepis.1